MNVNFPNREPVLVRNHEIRIVRRLPGGGDVKIRAGERIAADHILARTDPTSAAVKIAISDQLGVAPQEAVKNLLRPVGSTFGVGEALARSRKGLRNVVVASPIAGTLLSVDNDTGMAHMTPSGGGEFRSMVAGDVEFVDGKHSVSIRTVGSRLFGIIGLGSPVTGEIRVIASAPNEEFQASKVSADLAGKIVVGGSWATAAAIKKLAEVGAVGLITGGFIDREVLASLGVATDDRLSAWRLKPNDQSIGEEFRSGIAMMATEGFGPLAINQQAFDFLQELNGARAVLFTSTRVIGYLARPQLIVVNEDLLDDDAPTGNAMLAPGTSVRLIDQNALGQRVEVAGAPKRARRGDGNMIEVIEIQLANGQYKTVPLANIEIVA